MYEPLHHKYRPQTFSDLVGQGAIATTLTHALEQNRIAPAYLFCGPRGTGKTSSARILAKSLNCLAVEAPTADPCGSCDVCTSVNKGSALDIVEIDAASNTGVDNIRELIERSQFAPVQCRYKVYVIDECHMLSTAAFNALLKTLEEPPDRVVFVLATTDPQRVLPTIISRCQRFDFRRIPLPSMVRHLQYIATEESIAIAPSATQLVAQISQGGLRDAESLLDQLSLQADEITVESVWELVGAVPERDLLNLVRAIAADDAPALIDRVRQLMDKGREPLIVLQSLVGFYRDLLIAKRAPGREDLVAITPPTWLEMTDFAVKLSAAQLLASQQKLQSAEVQVKNTTQPRLWLEITLTGLLPSALGAVASLAGNASQQRALQQPELPTPVAIPPAILPPPVSPPVIADIAITPPAASMASSPVHPSAPSASPAVSPSESGTAPADAAPAEKPVEKPAEALSKLSSKLSAETPPAEVIFSNLADLWNKLLARLTPRATQVLMAQRGVLLGFDGVGAKVGFRSASLQKLAQSRVPNIEAAFESLFQRKIKVVLEVVDADASSDEAVAVPPPAPASPSAPVRRNHANRTLSSPLPSDARPSSLSQTSPQVSEPTGQPTENPFSVKGSNASNGSNADSKSISPLSSPLPGTSQSAFNGSPSSRLDAPADNIGFDQDQEKIKRFANFFNGQIVNLNDDTEKEADDLPRSHSPQPKSSDPGSDVPF